MDAKVTIRSLGVASVGALLLLSACAKSTTSNTAAGGGSAASGGSPTVSTATVAGVGTVLADASGMTLYYYQHDSGGMSACTGSCATAWPPLVLKAGVTSPTAGNGIDASKLGTITRPDGGIQVTYDGKPLYTYQGDASSGQATGQGVGGFYAVTVSGSSSGSGGSSSSSGGGGYHY
jgi:predicted lipoprotein with Yx(FWY)xxD motif